MSKKYLIYTDGGCLVNPGGVGGCAAIIIDQESGEIIKLKQGYKSSTNNRMEIRAVLMALHALKEKSIVKIVSDSMYVVNCGNGEWGMNTNLDLWNEFELLSMKHDISFKWVKGHQGNQFNEECDILASKAMEEDLIDDQGYVYTGSVPIRKVTRLVIPENIPQICSYQFNLQINPQCANDIKKLNNKANAAFKDFLKLKTNGRDGYSSLTKEQLIKALGNEIVELLTNHFDDERHALSSLRWYCRGLKLDYAIRKEQVSIEIAANVKNS